MALGIDDYFQVICELTRAQREGIALVAIHRHPRPSVLRVLEERSLLDPHATRGPRLAAGVSKALARWHDEQMRPPAVPADARISVVEAPTDRAEYEGRLVRLTQDLFHDWGRIPAGAIARVMGLSMKGASLVFSECECCGIRPRAGRVPDKHFEFVSIKPKAAKRGTHA